ncbi:hypothetical protein CIB48_g71 [Xylaria polymorpha]|nr:hypothetical protein CIB48_g71 [Xylaria polymorpha]
MATTPIQFLDGGLGTSLEDNGISPRSPSTSYSPPPTKSRLRGFSAREQTPSPGGVSRAEIPPFLNLAVSIVEQVKRPATKIALSLGPYGAVMIPSQEYTGRYDNEHGSVEKLFRWHADRISLFASVPRLDSRVDFVAFETVPRLDEILAIRKLTTLLASQSPDATSAGPLGRTRYWISCVFPGTGQVLPDGSTVNQVIRALLSLEHSDNPPWGIGINCTKIAELPQLVKAYEVSVKLLEEDGHLHSWPSLLLYPDGTNGEIYDTVTKTWKLPIGLGETVEGARFQSSWEQQLGNVVTQTRSRGCWRSIVWVNMKTSATPTSTMIVLSSPLLQAEQDRLSPSPVYQRKVAKINPVIGPLPHYTRFGPRVRQVGPTVLMLDRSSVSSCQHPRLHLLRIFGSTESSRNHH